jgi:O-antigen/teichoic acid export membrane protein
MAEVAYFSVPANLTSNLGVVSNHVASSVTPATSKMSGCGDLPGLKALYLKSLRWSWMALVPLVGLAMALGSEFIGAWLGAEFGRAVEPFMCLLVFGMGLYLFSSVPYSMAQGMGRAGPWAAIALGAGIINSVLAFFLIPQRGAQGAVEALCVSSILLILAMLVWLNLILKVSWYDIFKYVIEIRIVIITSVVSLAAFIISTRFQLSLFWIVLIGLAGAAIILASFSLWLDADERRWMQNKLHSLHIGSAQRL